MCYDWANEIPEVTGACDDPVASCSEKANRAQFPKTKDTTPRVPAKVAKQDTFGGESAWVREGNGQLFMVEVDLKREVGRDDTDVPGRTRQQFPWGQTRSFANIDGPSEGGVNGNRWLNKEYGYLDFLGAAPGVNDPDRIVRRGLANESLWFEKDAVTGDYAPLTTFYGQLVHGTDTFTFTEETGRQWIYFDNSASHPAGQRGSGASSRKCATPTGTEPS